MFMLILEHIVESLRVSNVGVISFSRLQVESESPQRQLLYVNQFQWSDHPYDGLCTLNECHGIGIVAGKACLRHK